MTDNFSNDENALLRAQIREQDLAANQKLQEIQGAVDEFARQKILNKLRQAEVEHEKLKLEFEQEAFNRVDNILSYVELSAAENEENFTSGIDGLLAKLFKFFNFMDSERGVETDPQVYRMIKKREEESWIAAVIKFLRDKFNKLIKVIFSHDLSFGEQIDKEIGKLFERLFGGNLSQEEEAAILEHLGALRNLKLKLQMFVASSVITVFAELLSAELTASVETTKEEGKEKTSAKEKEATKEVHEIIEIKVDAKEKPTVNVPVSLFDFSSGVVRPITLTKQELDLLPKPLANLVQRVQEYATSKENSGVPKQKMEKNKQAQPAPKPVAAPEVPGKVPKQKVNLRQVWYFKPGLSSRKDAIDAKYDNFNKEKISVMPGQSIEYFYNNQASAEQACNRKGNNLNKEKTLTKPKQKIDDFYRNFPEISEWKNDQVQEGVPSGVTGVKVDNHEDLIGKAPKVTLPR